MTPPVEIETERLRLRDFRPDERTRFIALCVDEAVGEWLGGALTRASAYAAFDRVRAGIAERGYGLWAVERKADGLIVGQVGLNPVPDDLPMAPAIEMSWRMFPEVWGQGYAGEAATAVLAWGRAHLPADAEIVAFTTRQNHRSEAIMRRIGLVRAAERDFDHPGLAEDHPLRPHIVYVAEPPAQ
jgi:RimJ/RimL family protein N-acetyltransferase